MKKTWFGGLVKASAFLAGAGLLCSEYEKRQLRLTPYTVSSGKIPPSFDGARIAVLADLHDCTIGEDNEILYERLKALRPDYILCAGDMVVKNRAFEPDRVVRLLARLARICPVWCGNGNHELYLKKKSLPDGRTAYDLYEEKLKKAGVRVLADETVRIRRGEEEIAVSGLDLGLAFYAKGFHAPMRSDYCERKLGAAPAGCYRVLIGHYPNYLPEYAAWGADLVVAGHMHGGTVRLPWLGGLMSSNYEFFPKYDRGQFSEKGCDMIVSGGLGTHSINIRFGGNYPEIPVITLKRQV